MRIKLLSLILLSSAFSFANEVQPNESQVDKAERKAAASERFRMKTGGFIVDTSKTKGAVWFVNAQNRISSELLTEVASWLQTASWIPCKTVAIDPVNLNEVSAIVRTTKWEVSVILVDDPTLPSSLVQAEGNWAIVNVHALNKGCKDDKQLQSRVKKQLLRSASMVFGCGYSLNSGGISQPMSDVEALDFCVGEFLPVDVYTTMQALAPKFHITIGKRCYYSKAVEEGWAPKPINKYQQAAWDRVHEIPAEPLKIKHTK